MGIGKDLSNGKRHEDQKEEATVLETVPLILVQALGRLEWRRNDGMTRNE